jgi:thioredoxin reductase
MKSEDVTIIGAGPAGIAAAIQLKRYGITPLLLEKEEIGGLLRNANLVENYPGFPSGITGSRLVKLFREQLQRVSILPAFEEVKKLYFKKKIFLVETRKKTYPSRTVVIASGTKPRGFADFVIPEEVKDKIFYEVYPILRARKKEIVIIGAGDAAFDYALNLSQNNEVTILNSGQHIRSLPLLLERAQAVSSISYHKNTRITRVSNNSQNGILLECKTLGNTWKSRADYLIFAIGREPQLDFLSEKAKRNFKALVKKGVLYLIGDVKNRNYRQTAIAVGDGIMAAMKICRRLKGVCS